MASGYTLARVHQNRGKHSLVVGLPLMSLMIDQNINISVRAVETSTFIIYKHTEGPTDYSLAIY